MDIFVFCGQGFGSHYFDLCCGGTTAAAMNTFRELLPLSLLMGCGGRSRLLCFPSRSGSANIASIGHWTVSHVSHSGAPVLPFCYAVAIGTSNSSTTSSSPSTTITTTIITITTRSVPREGGSTWIWYLLCLTAALGLYFLWGVHNYMYCIYAVLLISVTCTIKARRKFVDDDGDPPVVLCPIMSHVGKTETTTPKGVIVMGFYKMI